MRSVHLLFIGVLFFLLLPSQVNAQTQGWEWAKISTNSGTVEGCGVALGIDDGGSEGIYGLAFNEQGNTSINFGSVTYSNPNGYANALVVKYTSAGTALWAFGAQGNSSPIGITTDLHGSVYLFSSFTDSVLLGTTMFRTTSPAYFIAKISQSGSLIWAKKDGLGCKGQFNSGWYRAPGGGIKCDAANNVYVSSFYGGTGTKIGTDSLTNSGPASTADIFIAKYDSAGNVIWAKNVGGSKDDYVRAFSVSPSGRVGIAGTFSSPTMTVGSTTLTAAVATNPKIFIAMYDSSGNPLWADATGKNASMAASDYACWLTFDKWSNAYLTGTFTDTLFIAATPIVNPREGTGSMYVVKIDTTYHVPWYKTAISPATISGAYAWVNGLSMSTDDCGAVWIAGSMGFNKGDSYVNVSGHNIDSAPKTYYFPAHEQDPGFIAGFSATGDYVGGKALQSGFDDGNQVICGPAGDVYLVSDYEGGYLIAGSDNYIDTSDKEKFLIAKYQYDTAGCSIGHISEVGNAPEFSNDRITIYPNPAVRELTIKNEEPFPANSMADFYDLTGRLINTYSLSGNRTVISVAGLAPGMYQCRIITGDKQIIVRKLVVMR